MSQIYSYGGQPFFGGYTSYKEPQDEPYIVWKTGYVLSRAEEEKSRQISKSAELDKIESQGATFYQVIAGENACDVCLSHHGAVYLVENAVEGENLPPFHPNCRCKIQAFSLRNPNDDPARSEMIFWVETITYGDLSKEEQARALRDFYGQTDLSEEFIVRMLTSTEEITNVSDRLEAFFRLVDLAKDPIVITPDELKAFGWFNATQEEADRLNAAFAANGITTRESMIEFMAIAMAESGGGIRFIEGGEKMTKEEFVIYAAALGLKYNYEERGAGYIQVTWRTAHLEFLEFMGDDYDGLNTAEYIAENYPLDKSDPKKLTQNQTVNPNK